MVLTPSTMLPLGTEAPGFALPDATSGRTIRLEDFADCRAMVVMFICNHCPFVQHVRAGLAALGRDYAASSVGIVAINANDSQAHPEDDPARMKDEATEWGYVFPYLFDHSQGVAKAYTAACTPDFFLFDAARKLVYRGQLDGSRPGNDIPVTGEDLRSAIDQVLRGQPTSPDQHSSIGCNIKWRPGNAPPYFSGR